MKKTIKYLTILGSMCLMFALSSVGLSAQQIPVQEGYFTQKNNENQLGVCEGTIQDYGAAMVSFAMAVYPYDSTITVERVNQLGRSDENCFFNFNLAAKDLGLTLNIHSQDLLDEQGAKRLIQEVVKKDQRVMVGLKHESKGMHWVVVVDEDGQIYDPSLVFESLDQYLKDGYQVQRVYTLNKE